MMKTFSKFGNSLYVKVILATLLCLSTLSNDAKASHAMGMDLTYECLGGNQYEFTLNFYRDCSGAGAPTSFIMDINSASCFVTNNLTLNSTGVVTDISPLCGTALSTCSGGSYPGVEHYVYTGIMTLPANCSDWVFGADLFARNGSITNLVNPASQTLYIESTLDNSSGACNSSPTFTTLPIPYICEGQITNYSSGAIDSDGDSIVYSLVNALGGPNDTLAYIFPYSGSYPITTDSGIVVLDSLTGNMNLTPDTFQTCIVTVLVQEYRDSVLIGSIMRDIQLLVLDCGANTTPLLNSPLITNLSAGPISVDSTSIEACVGVPIYFDLIASDADTTDTIQFTTNVSNAIPGATFDTTGVNPVIGSFSWIPQASDVGFNTFTVTIQDDFCPIRGKQTYVFDIRIFDGVYAGEDITHCGVDSVQLVASGSNNYAWTPSTGLSNDTISNPMALMPTTTMYIVTGDSNLSCKYIDTVVVIVDTVNWVTASATDTVICVGNSVLLDVSGTPGLPNTSSWTYAWSPAVSLSDTSIGTPLASPSDTTTYLIEVANVCGTFTDSITIYTEGGTPVSAGPDLSFCYGGSVQITATGAAAYLWSPNLFLSCTACDKTAASPPSDMTYYVTGTDTIGCTTTDSVFVEVNGLPIDASSDITYVCSPGDTVNLLADGLSDCSDYSIQNIGHAPLAGAGTSVFLSDDEVSSGFPIGFNFNFYCNDYSTFYISSNGFITFNNDFDNGCCSGQFLPDVSTPNNLIAFAWEDLNPGSGGTITYATSGAAPNQTLAVTFNSVPHFGAGNITVQVILYEGSNIIDIHSTSMVTTGGNHTMGLENIDGTIAHVVAGRNSDGTWSAVNEGIRFSPLTSPPLDSNITYTWSPGTMVSDSTISNPTAAPIIDMTYIVEVNDLGCIQIDTVTVFVDSTEVYVSNDTTICFSDSATLLVTGNTPLSVFLWNPTNGLSDPTIANPTAAPSFTTNYTVGVVSGTGCTIISDTVTVEVETAPSAAFTSSSVDLVATFSNNSGANSTAYLWDFGDGFQASVMDPVHTYNANGTYNVCLTSTNLCGSNTSCSSITVAIGGCTNTVAAFDTIVSGLTVVFQDLSSDVDSWMWDFGDGSTSTVQNAVHTFAADTTYNVCLTTTNACSSDSICVMVTVSSTIVPCVPTVAGFSSGSVGLDAVFTNTSSDATAWSWDFGDGNTSTAQNPVNSYAADSTYNVCLISTNSCSSDTICANITVAASTCTSTNAAFTSTSSGLTLDFTDTSTDPTGWAWDFGDLNTSSLQNPSHSYADTGTYTVCLIVTNPCSADTVCSNITVTGCIPPSSSFTSTENELVATFVDASTNAVSWSWDFGDGNSSNSKNPTYTYASSGTYTVCLTTSSGCTTDVFCNAITVTACPLAAISAFMFTTSPLSATFTDLSVNVTNWIWDFGDGFSAVDQNPTHIYTLPDTYTVCLTSSNTCTDDTSCMEVTVGLTGIDDESVKAEMQVYPNPTDGILNISVPLGAHENLTFTVYNILGEVVFYGQQSKLNVTNTTSDRTEYSIDFGYLSDGAYLLRVQSGDIVFREQIIFSR